MTSRLDRPCRAFIQAALAAMPVLEYRPPTHEPGRHRPAIHSLALTAGIDADRVRVLDTFRDAGNQAEVRGIPVSASVALEAVNSTQGLVFDVRRVARTARS